MGIWDLSRVPGLVWERPRGTRSRRCGRQAPVDRRRAHLAQRARLVVVEVEHAVAAQPSDEDREHRGQALAGRVAADPPAHRQGLDQRVGVRRRRAGRGRDRHATLPVVRSAFRAWSRCQPVSSHSSSRILALSARDPRR